MKVITLSIAGIMPATARRIRSRTGGLFFGVDHGQERPNGWRLRFPLGARDFPFSAGESNPIQTMVLDDHYRLVHLNKEDRQGQPMHLLGKGSDDGTYLVLWSLSPGYRGCASFTVTGQAEDTALGYEIAHGGERCPCPAVHVLGPCRLRWARTGLLYGSPAEWEARYDGGEWSVLPAGLVGPDHPIPATRGRTGASGSS